jgi:hypothetical protein
MENFYSWMMKPVSREDVEVWFNMNNMIYEKRELFADFTYSLDSLIKETYLGNEPEDATETRVLLTQEEKNSHFDWCWSKTVGNFAKENIKFNVEGEHKEYYQKFYEDLFYSPDNKTISENIHKFFDELFDEKKVYTKSDLDMVTDIYKILNKNLI